MAAKGKPHVLTKKKPRSYSLLHFTVHSECLGYELDVRRIVVQFPPGGTDILLLANVETRSGTHPLATERVSGNSSSGVKRLGYEADLSPSGGQIKNAWSYTSTPAYVFIEWCLMVHRDKFTSTTTPSIPRILKRPHRMKQYSMLYARPSVAMLLGGTMGWVDSLVLDSHTHCRQNGVGHLHSPCVY